MDYAAVSERFIAAQFPTAVIAVMGGSTARQTRTATSDIDLLLLGEDLFTDDRTGLAATFEYEGEIFEVFAYTHEGFTQWAASGMEQHRPVIVQMLIDGVEIRGGRHLVELREEWRGMLAAGPTLGAHDIELRRYALTDLLDDLRDATDPLEQHVVASALFESVAQLILITENRWIGTGKYLPRRLREFDPQRAQRLADPLLVHDFPRFISEVERELDLAGGRVQAGFVR